MPGNRTSRSLLPLLVLAVLLRSLVADGYMPTREGTVALCTASGMVMAPIDPGSANIPIDAETDVMPECPWDSAFFTLLLPHFGVFLPAHRPARVPPDFLASSRIVTNPKGIPPVRGPPDRST